MGDIKACLTPDRRSRRTVRGSCVRLKSLSPGDIATLRLSVLPNRRAKGKVRLTLSITSDGGSRSVTRNFRAIAPRACASKGGKKGGGLLCGDTDHL